MRKIWISCLLFEINDIATGQAIKDIDTLISTYVYKDFMTFFYFYYFILLLEVQIIRLSSLPHPFSFLEFPNLFNPLLIYLTKYLTSVLK